MMIVRILMLAGASALLGGCIVIPLAPPLVHGYRGDGYYQGGYRGDGYYRFYPHHRGYDDRYYRD